MWSYSNLSLNLSGEEDASTLKMCILGFWPQEPLVTRHMRLFLWSITPYNPINWSCSGSKKKNHVKADVLTVVKMYNLLGFKVSEQELLLLKVGRR